MHAAPPNLVTVHKVFLARRDSGPPCVTSFRSGPRVIFPEISGKNEKAAAQ